MFMKNAKLLTKGEIAFRRLSVVVLGFTSLIAILPFILIFMASITEEKSLTQYGYSFFQNNSV